MPRPLLIAAVFFLHSTTLSGCFGPPEDLEVKVFNQTFEPANYTISVQIHVPRGQAAPEWQLAHSVNGSLAAGQWQDEALLVSKEGRYRFRIDLENGTSASPQELEFRRRDGTELLFRLRDSGVDAILSMR